MGSKAYGSSGVDLEAGYEAVRRYKAHVKRTNRPGCVSGIGSFGGMFDLASLGYKEPMLVSGTDGVGTKLKLAFEMDKHDTIGIDAVAMCVNDVLAQGAEPLYFLDYVALGHAIPEKLERIVAGVADGCVQAGCALIGGETAEMPGMYSDGEYDIAGFAVGVVEKSKLIDDSKVAVGDTLVGIASTGVHSNGFSLVRKIIADNKIDLHSYSDELGGVVGEVLLTPTRIYCKQVKDVIDNVDVHGVAHITGGGFDENIPRILTDKMGLDIVEGSWPILPVFKFLEKYGKVDHREMFNIYNMGIGMVIAVANEDDAKKVIDILAKHGDKAYVIGKVTDNAGKVVIHK
ncbi:MAG: phosphoribosylformylglycinamidine cyclo-ligase [Acholeplasmatales bacterium]|nr:phosphoribosylformylglycinamidine cyclo-ligase [Acholeplasmatales bacterium]